MPAQATRLWRRWRAGRDTEAFEQLVRPEIAYALDFARRMGADRGEAEDVVQETLAVLAREPGNEPVDVGLRAWMCRRVGLRVRMLRRAAARRRAHERAAGLRPRPGHDPTAGFEAREEVEAALGHLPPDQRQAVVLRYLHDLDYREMAYVVGATENALRLRVHKGLAVLKKLLGARAPALLAALALPAVSAEAALVHGALAGAAGSTTGKGVTALAGWLGTKTGASVATGAVVAAAITTAVVTRPAPPVTIPPAPAPVVAAVEPEPEPEPPPGLAPWWRVGDRGIHTVRLVSEGAGGRIGVRTVQEVSYREEVLAAARGMPTRVRRTYERHRIETTVGVGLPRPVTQSEIQPMEGETVELERAGDRWRPAAGDSLFGEALPRLRELVVAALPAREVARGETWVPDAPFFAYAGSKTFGVYEGDEAHGGERAARIRITTPDSGGRGPEGRMLVGLTSRKVYRVELSGPFELETAIGDLSGSRRLEATWEPLP